MSRRIGEEEGCEGARGAPPADTVLGRRATLTVGGDSSVEPLRRGEGRSDVGTSSRTEPLLILPDRLTQGPSSCAVCCSALPGLDAQSRLA